nr:NAD(P)-binding protein [Colletotrichum truncatum]KAF6785922.1 NAD(P)-binding protein [Colletotrichum truncatum]
MPGLTSVGATMALCFNDAFRNQNSQLGPATVDFLIRAHNYVDEVGLASALGQSMHQLPPRDKAIQMIEEYLKNINSFYPITDKESLLKLTERLYGPDRGHVGSLDHSFFYLVVSLGALSVGHKYQSSDALDDLYEIMFQRAWSMIHDCIASPCETSLQILLLYVVHHMYMIKDGIAWVLCGFAMRIAQSIGLHREFPEDMDLPEHQIRLRSRLWTIVFSVDAKLSLSQGRSPGLEEGATDKSITPAKVRVELESAPFPDASTINCWTYTLSKIQNRFCNIMHSKNHTVSRLKAIAKVDEDLTAWRDAIPATCRPNQPILVPPESYTKVLLLHLDYMNLSRSVHWAVATLTATQAGELPNLGLRIKACETLCLDAARSFIRALNDSASCLGDRNVFIFSVQLNNYIAAISVLYRSICHSPSSMTARADLEYLRTGKLHMELDMPRIHKTYASNSVKTLLNDILASAENLVRDNGN